MNVAELEFGLLEILKEWCLSETDKVEMNAGNEVEFLSSVQILKTICFNYMSIEYEYNGGEDKTKFAIPFQFVSIWAKYNFDGFIERRHIKFMYSVWQLIDDTHSAEGYPKLTKTFRYVG